jgi:hypothetical protein
VESVSLWYLREVNKMITEAIRHSISRFPSVVMMFVSVGYSLWFPEEVSVWEAVALHSGVLAQGENRKDIKDR